MWPEKLTEYLKAIRGGLVFNPLDEIQKRATTFGENMGYNLEHNMAVADYSRTHPKSQRAREENMTNGVMLALSMWKPIESVPEAHLAQVDKSAPERIIAPAMANKKTGLFNTGTAHFDALPNLMRKLAETGNKVDADVHGWFTSHGRIVSDAQAYKIKKAELSPEIMAQIATRAEQSGKPAKLTSEDVRGKLTANRGTRAAPPMTGADLDAIMARKQSGALPDIGDDAIEALTKRGGFTVDTRTGFPVGEGFAVGAGSEPGHSMIKMPLSDLRGEAIQDWFTKNAAKFPKGSVLGGWVDNGTAYIEPSTLVSSEAEAHALGAKRGEKEIYDFKNKRSVPVRSDSRVLADSAAATVGKVVGTILPKNPLQNMLSSVVKSGKPFDWSKIAPPKPEVIGVEGPDVISSKLAPNNAGVAGFIQPGSTLNAGKLSIRNQVAAEMQAADPTNMPLDLLNPVIPSAATEARLAKKAARAAEPDKTLPNTRGYGRAETPMDRHHDEMRQIDSAWNVSFAALRALRKQVEQEPTIRRTELADALRGGPKPPKGVPDLMGAYTNPDYIPTVEAVKYAKKLPHQFEHEIAKAQKHGNLFYTGSESPSVHRTPNSKAIDIEIAARNVIKQAQAGVFVPPHATPAEAAAIIGLGEKVTAGLHKINPEIWDALQKAMNAARFIHLKD